jgi:hypothetical protein
MSKNGKAKGSAWERDVARFLTFWASGQEKDLWFWRSPASGGLTTLAKHMNVSGDLVSLTPDAAFLTNLFSIECKVGYPDLDAFQHLKGNKSFELKNFWVQCCNDAKKANKQPLLIYKRRGCDPMVGIGKIIEVPTLECMVFFFNDIELLKLFKMKDFFDIVKPEHLKEIGEHLNGNS